MLRESLRELCAENRTATRHSLEVPAKVQIGYDCFRPVRTLDLSHSGARLEVDKPLERGTVLALNLTPEPLRHIAVAAEVMWTAPSWKEGRFEVGIRFHTMSKADRMWFAQFRDLN